MHPYICAIVVLDGLLTSVDDVVGVLFNLCIWCCVLGLGDGKVIITQVLRCLLDHISTINIAFTLCMLTLCSMVKCEMYHTSGALICSWSDAIVC